MIHESIASLTVPIDSVSPWPGNPRRGNVDVVRESLRVHGQYVPIVVQRSSGHIVKGNHTWHAAVAEGWGEIAVATVDVDDVQAARIVAVDNRSSDLGSYDSADLAALLGSLPELTGTGYDDADLSRLLDSIRPTGGGDGGVPDPPSEPVTHLGDVWELGPHRLVCGDATDPVVHGPLDVPRGCILLTDPPYGIALDTDYSSIVGSDKVVGSIKGQGRTYRAVIGDDEPFDPGPLLKILDGAPREEFWFGADYYRSRLSDDDRDGSWLVWDKRTEDTDVVIGSGFELIWSRQHHKRDLLRIYWLGAYGSADARGRMHPTQKPLALLSLILQRWSREGDVVLDAYAGSGSTLIACHETGRVARLIELDPAYCDVIIRRYHQRTGQVATRDGVPFPGLS